MKLSVIISSYNFEKYIEECIISFINQRTNFEYEILVRDDGSEDNTKNILLELSKKYKNLRVLDGSKNLGALKNINTLLKNAKGKYITYLDGDDYLTDMDTLQKQVDFLDNNPEYVLHSCGYKWLGNDGEITPSEGNFCGLKSVITQKDMLENNYVTFCRTFRNIKNLLKDTYGDIKYLDWLINFNILSHGLGKSENWCAGHYRITNEGMITSQTAEEKNKTFEDVKNFLEKEYYLNSKESIVIIDSFVHSKNIENRLVDFLKKLKEMNKKVLLVNNKHFSDKVYKYVDYIYFDKRNQLLEYDDYKNSYIIDFWKKTESFIAHDLLDVVQFHGLAVMINFKNALEYAKTLGFESFERLEIDCILGEESKKFIKSVPELLKRNNKKSLVYYNHEDVTSDIVFWYMYGNIDDFIEIVPDIQNEDDFRKCLVDLYGEVKYVLVEKIFYDKLKQFGEDNFIIRTKNQFHENFCDTPFNQETSPANIPKKYQGTTTRLYRIQYIENDEEKYKDDMLLISWNYSSSPKNRTIDVVYKDGTVKQFEHNIKRKSEKNDYQVDYVGFDVDSINVYENGILLYTEINEDLRNNVRYE